MLSILLSTSDPTLDTLCRSATTAIVAEAELKNFGVAVGVPDRKAGTVRWGSFQGDTTRYPASVVKLFWLAYAHRRMTDGKLKRTPELDRAMKDMIVESVNDATALVVDATTETTGGAELSPKNLKKWMDKRQAANRWLTGLGYAGINASQKTWNEGPYGRERQGYGPNFELRNAMSPLAGLRLLSEIMMDKIVDPAACASMRELLQRTDPKDGQRVGFTGEAIGDGCDIWSKAGWTSTVRHDLAWIKTPDGREVVLAVFTVGQGENVVPKIARELLKGLDIPVKG